MTLRRQWMVVLIVSTILSVCINSFILSSLINKYFVNYSTDNYNKRMNQIVKFSKEALLAGNYSEQQLGIQLETYLNDPITRIRLFDANGNLRADVGDSSNMMNGMMNNGMMGVMMESPSEETDITEIADSGNLLGRLSITRYSSMGNSLETRMFKASLIGNSFFSIGIVLIFVLIAGAIISNKMSKDLMNTAAMAINMDLGNQKELTLSKVREIRIIQQSLETLQARLNLKQTSRKRLIDELVHQTRTPLTILKTHLEGFEDGIISMTPDEIKTCEAQIENITSIITNMSGMIDAEKDIDSVKVEEFELNQLIRQILGGLRVQFDKKQIELTLTNQQKVNLKTDKYKLSQSIYNILTNAYKFTEPRGKVAVSYKAEGAELVIEVEDTGIGISKEDTKRLFNAYTRGSNAVNISGEGIGLYVVKENLKKINGDISVESELGKGSRFTIKIPREIVA